MSGNEDDIAIIGMAGLFPQADDVEVFWSNVLGKVDAVTECGPDWLSTSDIFNPESADPLKIYTRRGGFLGDLSRFDPKQFGTMPLSVAGAQPDQFIALKLAQDALIDAGYPAGKHDGSGTGVILGHAVHAHRGNTNGVQQVWFHSQTRNLLAALFPDLPQERVEAAVELLKKGLPHLTPEAVPGLVPNILTGRICNRLDLMGPNYIIDAACSSSLIAIDLAISELRAGRAEMMLAGGVNTTTSPLVYSVFCSVNALSRDGRIRPFDANANGTVLGEGAGIVVLKRLRDALAADDRIYAVIKGVGQSSDGKSSGLMAPRLEGEVLAMRRAYGQTGIDPDSIGLVEAHGTGIPLGDRTEIDAMRTIFGSRRGELPTIPIGSVKSMIGHCIPASGSASVMKLALALKNGVIPPTLCDEVSDRVGLESTPFFLATEARPWVHTAPTPRRAAINAFGFGGINAHMILEEAPVGQGMDPTAAFISPTLGVPAPAEQVFVFAGADRAEVLAGLDAFAALLPAAGDLAALSGQRWDMVTGQPGPSRLAIVADSPADLAKKVATARDKVAGLKGGSLQTRNGIYYEDQPIGGKVAFLFPGEMAQYPGMMRDAAMAYPVVRGWFDLIAALTEGRREVRLQDVIFPPGNGVGDAGQSLLDELMHRVDYGSEMVFAADQAVFALLTAMGIKADAMLGHSTGENAAIVASGCLDLDRAGIAAMIARMNEVFSGVEESGTVPSGVLLNVAALGRSELEALLAANPDVHFTMDNCPNQAILFGQPEEIEALTRQAVERGAVCTRLPISWGYHTHYVAPMAEAFGCLFDEVPLAESPVTLYSCATAAPFPEARADRHATAVAQYTSRVRFTEAVSRLHDDGCRVFVECGPNAVLSGFVRDILGARPHLVVSADNRRRGMLSQLRHLAGQLFAVGVAVDARDLLIRREDAAQTRRRIAREKHRAASRLPSELPFFNLNDETVAELTRIVRGGRDMTAPPDVVLPPVSTPSLAADPAPIAPAPVASLGAVARGSGGVRLRAAPAPRPAPRTDWRARPRPAAPANRIEVLDLSASFEVPFAFQAYLMRGTPSTEAVLPHLGAAERAEAETILARGRLTGWQDWALSRLAVKRAAATLITGASGPRPLDACIEVAKASGGAPVLRLDGIPAPTPAVSIAHVNGVAVGAAAEPGWRIGIDYELPERVREPTSFLSAVTGLEEWRGLGLAPSQDSAALVWSAKEAAAKALGLGLQGRPGEFVLSGGEDARAPMRVRYGSWTVSVRACRIGEAICALGWIPDLGGSGVS